MVRTGRLRTSDRRTRLLGRGAKQCGEHMPESFTALFTARDGGVPVSSAAGCGPFPTCYRSHKLLGRLRGHGRDLERRQFSPVKTELISIRLKDTAAVNSLQPIHYTALYADPLNNMRRAWWQLLLLGRGCRSC